MNNKEYLIKLYEHFKVPDKDKKYLDSKINSYWGIRDYMRWFRLRNYQRK